MSPMLCDSIKSSGAWLKYKGDNCNLGVYFHAHYSISTKHISALHFRNTRTMETIVLYKPF